MLLYFIFILLTWNWIECAEIAVEAERINNLFLGASSYSNYKLRNYLLKHCRSDAVPQILNENELGYLLENPNLNWAQTCTAVLHLLDLKHRTFLQINPILAQNHPKTLLPLIPRLDPTLKLIEIFNPKHEIAFTESGYNLIYSSNFVSDNNTVLLLKLFCQVFSLKNFRPVIEGKKINLEGCIFDEEEVLLGNLHQVYLETVGTYPSKDGQNLKKVGQLVFNQSKIVVNLPEYKFTKEIVENILGKLQSEGIVVLSKSERLHRLSVVLSGNSIYVGDVFRLNEDISGIVKFNFRVIDFQLIESLLFTEFTDLTLSQNENFMHKEPFHYALPLRSGNCILKAWLMALATTCKLLNIDAEFYKTFKLNLKIHFWKLMIQTYENTPLEPIREAMMSLFINLNVNNNKHFPLPLNIPILDDTKVLEYIKDLYDIKFYKNPEFYFFPTLSNGSEKEKTFYHQIMKRGAEWKKRKTNIEDYLKGVLNNYKRRNGLPTAVMNFFSKSIANEELKKEDPYLVAVALIYFEGGKGLWEFYKSLDENQLAYVRKYANKELCTLLDMYCAWVYELPNPKINFRDLHALLYLHNDIDSLLRVLDISHIDRRYARFLFLQIDEPNMFTLFFQLCCFERSRYFTEEYFQKALQIAKEIMCMPQDDDDHMTMKLSIAMITDDDEYGDPEYMFNWMRSNYLKIRRDNGQQ
jgi:hypothetical protein